MNVEFVEDGLDVVTTRFDPPDKPSVAYTETEINALMSIFKQAGFE